MIEAITKKDNNDDNIEKLKTKSYKLGGSLKTTSWKNNIMKEARELFYDKDFMNKLDSNPHLLCFNNYVEILKLKLIEKVDLMILFQNLLILIIYLMKMLKKNLLILKMK